MATGIIYFFMSRSYVPLKSFLLCKNFLAIGTWVGMIFMVVSQMFLKGMLLRECFFTVATAKLFIAFMSISNVFQKVFLFNINPITLATMMK